MFDVAVENAFDFSSAEYAELFARTRATAFQHPVWLATLYRGLAVALGAQPLIVTVRHGRGGPLALVLPLVRRRYAGLRVIEFADLRVSDYAAPVCDPETFAALAGDPAAMRRLRAALKPYDILRIGKLRQDSLPVETLLGLPEREAMGTNAYATPLGGSLSDWQSERLQRSFVRELAKKSRQLARRGTADFGFAAGADEIVSVMQALQRFRGIRFAHEETPDVMQQPAYFEFYRAVALAGEGAFTRVYRLKMDGAVAAAALALVHDSTAHVVLSGFDEAGYGRQSVGNLLFEYIAGDSIAHGEGTLDFTIGDEPYKTTFGASPSPMWQVSRAGSPLGRAADLVVRRMPAARSFARRIVRGTGAGGAGRPAAETAATPAGDAETAAR